jgi:hypothetical protein
MAQTRKQNTTQKRSKQQLAVRRKPDDPEQYKRFLEAAREAEADNTNEGADRAFKKVVSKPSVS